MCRQTVRRRYDRERDDHRHRCRAPLGRDPPRDARAGPPGPRVAVVVLPLPRVPVAAGLRGGRRGRRPGRLRGPPRRGLPRLAGQPTDGTTVGTEVSPYGPELRVRYPRLDVDAALAAARAAMPALARRRRADPRRGLPRDHRPDQRPVVRDRPSRHAHHRPAVRDGLPGRRPARPGPRRSRRSSPPWSSRARARVGGLGEAGQGRPDPDAEGLPDRAARRGPGHRLQHLPDLERLPRPVRLARHRQPRRGQAAPARRAAARDHASRSRARRARGRLRPGPGARWPPSADGEGLAKTLAEHPEVAIIDYTGGPGFGDWLEREAAATARWSTPRRPASTPSSSTRPTTCAGVLGNLAFSLSLYSGQMCTTPQNIYVPRDGIETDEGHLSFDEVGADAGRALIAVQRRRRPRGRDPRRDGQRRRARPGRRRCRLAARPAARWSWPRGGGATRPTPTRSSARPALVAVDVRAGRPAYRRSASAR